MLLRCRKSSRLTFLKGESSLIHHLAYILVGLIGQTLEVLNFGVSSGAYIRDSRQLVCRVSILDTEAGRKLLGLLVKVLAEVLVQLRVVCARGHVKAIVPLWNTVASTSFLPLHLLLLLAGRFRSTFHLVVHHLRLIVFSVRLLLLLSIIVVSGDAIRLLRVHLLLILLV